MDFSELLTKQSLWELGNAVLYELCRKHPKHQDEQDIAAKIWLIGRSYATAIERRKKKIIDEYDEYKGDKFYTEKVVPQIKESEIDCWINASHVSNDVKVHLEIHKKLTDLFKNISGDEKRSLASKYLHFHLPDKFFIYDSRAVVAINKLLRELGEKRSITEKEKNGNEYDKEYAVFYRKCLKIRELLSRRGISNDLLSCRKIDDLLLTIAEKATVD